MITDRQVAEKAFRRTRWMMAATVSLALLAVLCQLAGWVVGAGVVLPKGLFEFSLLALGFNAFFYPLTAVTHWLIMGYISDKERG
jgi:hypothetical protein